MIHYRQLFLRFPERRVSCLEADSLKGLRAAKISNASPGAEQRHRLELALGLERCSCYADPLDMAVSWR